MKEYKPLLYIWGIYFLCLGFSFFMKSQYPDYERCGVIDALEEHTHIYKHREKTEFIFSVKIGNDFFPLQPTFNQLHTLKKGDKVCLMFFDKRGAIWNELFFFMLIMSVGVAFLSIPFLAHTESFKN